jgi:hypothetical protein
MRQLITRARQGAERRSEGHDMSTTRFAKGVFRLTAIAALAWSAAASATAEPAQTCAQQDAASGSRSPIERIRLACPLLGEIVEKFALMDLGEMDLGEMDLGEMDLGEMDPGEDFPGPHALRAREVATFAAVAASTDAETTQRHTRHALATGATRLEIEAALYLVTLQAGVPKAIEATRIVSRVLAEQPHCLREPGRADIPQL